MAKFAPDDINTLMRKELRLICRKIDFVVYGLLKHAMELPVQVYVEYNTSELYFGNQLLNKELRPWYIADCIRSIGYTEIAEQLEKFAQTFNFSRNDKKSQLDVQIDPELAVTMQLLQHLKLEISAKELLKIREGSKDTFEGIFRDMLIIGKLTPTLEDIKSRLLNIERENLAYSLEIYSDITSTMQLDNFQRIVVLCLDILDPNVLTLQPNL